ncbi:hypothetical protein D9Q98_006416 [Chlorella vulgaris]|uniref:SCP domain-containing protein n=1 Tax=Chlorella vulgaris TaxID=3077 RepID=A0A9D4TKD3_CHLVU|nr:hypothetical protein D9Q98_006416 [Chlorella vulgaris]
MAHLRLLLLFSLSTHLCVSALTTSKCVSPTGPKGVLTVLNQIRAKFNAPPVKWNAALASASQQHANKCRWEHSLDAGENIFFTYGYQYPIDGLDACAYADKTWASQAASYNFKNPGVSRDGGQTHHFTQLVWRETSQVGCGVARCPNLANSGTDQPSDFVVCQYLDSGNWLGYDGSYKLYDDNVARTDCMVQTGDDWCDTCTSSTCNSCYQRAVNTGVPDGTPPIRLHASTGKCISKCPAGAANSANCAACTASGACFQCRSGWKMNAAKRCLVLDCDQRYGSECDACTGSQCSKCSAVFQLNASQTGCIKAKRRKAALVRRQPRKIRHLA